MSPVSHPAEDLSARLVVDGVPYRESVGSYALLSRHVGSGILERDMVLNLQVWGVSKYKGFNFAVICFVLWSVVDARSNDTHTRDMRHNTRKR